MDELLCAVAGDLRQVEIVVHDQGGLHPSVTGDRAFGRFGRGVDAGGRPGSGRALGLGLGLGLALVCAIAEPRRSRRARRGPRRGVRAALRLPVRPG